MFIVAMLGVSVGVTCPLCCMVGQVVLAIASRIYGLLKEYKAGDRK